MSESFSSRMRPPCITSKDARKLILAVFPDDPIHGLVHNYMLGCRCPKCKQAASDYWKQRRRKKKGTI